MMMTQRLFSTGCVLQLRCINSVVQLRVYAARVSIGLSSKRQVTWGDGVQFVGGGVLLLTQGVGGSTAICNSTQRSRAGTLVRTTCSLRRTVFPALLKRAGNTV